MYVIVLVDNRLEKKRLVDNRLEEKRLEEKRRIFLLKDIVTQNF